MLIKNNIKNNITPIKNINKKTLKNKLKKCKTP